jgi:hypothetical protein
MPDTTTRQRNWAPWIGLLLALAAMLSNGVYFLGLPGQRADASALPHSATAGSIASGANPNEAATPPKAVLLVFYRGYW